MKVERIYTYVLVEPHERAQATRIFPHARVLCEGDPILGERIHVLLRTTMQDPESVWERVSLSTRMVAGGTTVRFDLGCARLGT